MANSAMNASSTAQQYCSKLTKRVQASRQQIDIRIFPNSCCMTGCCPSMCLWRKLRLQSGGLLGEALLLHRLCPLLLLPMVFHQGNLLLHRSASSSSSFSFTCLPADMLASRGSCASDAYRGNEVPPNFCPSCASAKSPLLTQNSAQVRFMPLLCSYDIKLGHSISHRSY